MNANYVFLDVPVNQVPSQPVQNMQQANGAQLQYPVASQGQPQGYIHPAYNPGHNAGEHQQYPMQPQVYNPGQMAGGQQQYPMQPQGASYHSKPQEPYNPNNTSVNQNFSPPAGYPMGGGIYPDAPPPYPGNPTQ